MILGCVGIFDKAHARDAAMFRVVRRSALLLDHVAITTEQTQSNEDGAR